MAAHICCKATLPLKSNYCFVNVTCKIPINNSNNSLFTKSHTPLASPPSSPQFPLKSKSHPHRPTPKLEDQGLSTLLETHQIKGSDPLQILKDDRDWTQHHLRAVVRFLKQSSSRSKDLIQVFDLWKNIEKPCLNEFNYEKLIGLLVEEGLMEEAISTLQEMMRHELRPSLAIYNSIIRSFAMKGRFEDALYYLEEMKEINLKPDTRTYDGLIRAYGKHGMFDEMARFVKKMEADKCPPDHVTYNLLIKECSRAGLLTRMEKLYRILISKRMYLQSSTLVAMLEAYANFGILDKMEKAYRRVLNSKTILKEDLIRKLARVYMLNHMFSRLDDLALDLSSKTGKTDLVWCLHILSHACLLSRKSMDSVLHEMELENLPWNTTVVNVILLAHAKMKDFKRLKVILKEVAARHVKPDIVTLGAVFDAYKVGFDGMRALNTWRKVGFLDQAVEMNTDDLVLTAFGKGYFLRSCEEIYSSFQSKPRGSRIWTYQHLIDLVFEHNNKRLPQLMAAEQCQK